MEDKTKFKQRPFSVPDNYFQNLENEVMQKITQEKKKSRKLLLWAPASAAAAAIILLFLFFEPFATKPTILASWEIEQYFENTSTPYDEVLIYENIPENNNSVSGTLSDEEIIDYLLEDNYANELILSN